MACFGCSSKKPCVPHLNPKMAIPELVRNCSTVSGSPASRTIQASRVVIPNTMVELPTVWPAIKPWCRAALQPVFIHAVSALSRSSDNKNRSGVGTGVAQPLEDSRRKCGPSACQRSRSRSLPDSLRFPTTRNDNTQTETIK